MAAPVSTVPAVKAWLFTQMKATCTAATGIDLLVRYGQPGPEQPEDVVSLGATRNRTVSDFAMTGSLDNPNALIEEYEIEVDIDVSRSGEDVAQEATERAWALVAQVEECARADGTAGGRVYEIRPASTSDDPEWTDNGWLNVHAVVTLHVSAVL